MECISGQIGGIFIHHIAEFYNLGEQVWFIFNGFRLRIWSLSCPKLFALVENNNKPPAYLGCKFWGAQFEKFEPVFENPTFHGDGRSAGSYFSG